MLGGNSYVDSVDLPPLPHNKSATDVSADYLFKLRQAIRSALQKYLGRAFETAESNIRWCFTGPIACNDHGKAALRRAIVNARFLRDDNDDQLQFVSEPEASILFCSKAGLLRLHSLDAVLVVNAGGATVDLIAYEVTGEQPFTLAKLTLESGDSCG